MIHLAGELDLTTAAELQRRLLAVVCAGSGGVVGLDLSGVTFIDAHSIGIIVHAWQVAQSRGRPLRVCGLRALVADLFILCGLKSLIAPDGAEELAAVHER